MVPKLKKIMGKKEQFYPKLKTLIQEFGEWEVNILALSREWNIPQTTVHRWKEQIVKELGPLDLNEFGRNIQLTGLSNIKLCQRLIRTNTGRDKLLAMRAYNETVEKYTNFLESFGYKEKVAEKLIHDTNLNWEDFNAAYEANQPRRKTKGSPKK